MPCACIIYGFYIFLVSFLFYLFYDSCKFIVWKVYLILIEKKKINKLVTHFGEDKTKSILFSITRGLKEINISFAGHSIKQHEIVEYLGCQLDSKLSGEDMASKVLKK